MLSEESCHGVAPAWLHGVWQRIQSVLEKERHRIYEDIKQYPRPIPACDVEFNHLLQERANVLHELEHMRECCRDSFQAIKPLEMVSQFVRASRYIDAVERKEILTFLSDPRS